MTLKLSEWWPTTGSLIQAGGIAGGCFLGFFKGVAEKDIYDKKPELVISCEDVVGGGKHQFVMKLGEGPKGITIPAEPG